jgi:hypothetical protein
MMVMVSILFFPKENSEQSLTTLCTNELSEILSENMKNILPLNTVEIIIRPDAQIRLERASIQRVV